MADGECGPGEAAEGGDADEGGSHTEGITGLDSCVGPTDTGEKGERAR